MTDGQSQSEGEKGKETIPPHYVSEVEDGFDVMKLEPFMESVVRVTLAGLGGSVVGISQEKRLESIRVVTGSAAAAAARRKRSPSAAMSNLPATWAISCMAFCSIIEASRHVSPTTLVLSLWEPDSLKKDSVVASSLRTIGDYAFGGTIAGIAGSFGRSTHLRQRLPNAMFRGPRRFFGLVPGFALGFAAGLLQASIDYGLAYAESRRHLEDNPVVDDSRIIKTDGK